MDSIWYEILVVILSIFLGIFLVLSIVILVKVYQIVKVVKRITEHAEDMADRAEHVAAFFEKTAVPVALVKLVSNISDAILKKGKK